MNETFTIGRWRSESNRLYIPHCRPIELETNAATSFSQARSNAILMETAPEMYWFIKKLISDAGKQILNKEIYDEGDRIINKVERGWR